MKKTATLAALALPLLAAAQTQPATVVINADLGTTTIDRNIYGQFSEHLGKCIYEGLWVGPESPIANTNGVRNDVADALTKIKMPNLRWPGGCFADTYHWMDGIGPKEARKKIVNTNWGGVVEDNSFGTHEFLDMCERLGVDAYVCCNVGSGTTQELSDWIEYMTAGKETPMGALRAKNGREKPWKVKFLAVGNESWGCGGNMLVDYYSNEYRKYQTFAKDYSGNHLLKVAGGSNAGDYSWTDVMMQRVPANMMWGLSLHYYAVRDWSNHGSATKFSDQQYYETMRCAEDIDDVIAKHDAVMTKYDPEKKVSLVVDEWGTWWDVEPGTNPGFLYQQNTMRDALVAAVTLNIFHKHADRVRMANIAQVVNVLQAMVLTQGEKMILTPTYHVFDMYKVHQDATLLPSIVTCATTGTANERLDQVSVSASKDKQGAINVSLANVDLDKPAQVKIDIRGAKIAKINSATIIKAADIHDMNTFEKPDVIDLNAFDGAKLKDGVVTLTLPAMSIVTLNAK